MKDKKTLQCRVEVVVNPFGIHDPRVLEIIRYVADHYDESVTLKLISQKLRHTPEHLSRLLQEKAGTGFRELCQKIRMTQAGILLEKGASAKKVAALCGWKSLSAFYRSFKKCFHMAPKAYQKFWTRLQDDKRWLLWKIERVETEKGARKKKELKRELLVGRFGQNPLPHRPKGLRGRKDSLFSVRGRNRVVTDC